jgi:cell division protein FtsW (lipid II flippase)
MRTLRALFSGFDVYLVASVLVLTALGLVTMYSYQGDNEYFNRQIIWITVAVVLMLLALIPDYRFLRIGNTTFLLFLLFTFLLVLVLFMHRVASTSASSHFNHLILQSSYLLPF